MKAEILDQNHLTPSSLALSQSLKNIYSSPFKKSNSLKSLDDDLLINHLARRHNETSESRTEQTPSSVSEVHYCEIKTRNDQVAKPLDRRSFYDNHKWIDEIQEVDIEEEEDDDDDCTSPVLANTHISCTIVSNEEIEDEENLEDYQDTLSIREQIQFKSEKNLQMESGGQVERDAFDDLIDLSHRVTKNDMLKRDDESGAKSREKPHTDTDADNLTENNTNTCTSSNTKDSNTSSLPPLPYSFVRLEKSKSNNNNNNISKNASNSILTSPKHSNTTRLIIPMNQTPLNSTTSNNQSDSNLAMSQNCLQSETQESIVQNACLTSNQMATQKMLNRSNSSSFPAKKCETNSTRANDSSLEWDQVRLILGKSQTFA